MDKITDSPWFTRLLALFFAVLLFINANAGNKTVFNQVGPNFEASVDNVPIELKYDKSKYYVSGYEESTNVQLRSANKVLLDKESNPQTRNFSVQADLTKFGEGTHEVPLTINNLNGAVNSSLAMKTIHVTIEKIKTTSFKVEPVVSDELLAEGYELSDFKCEPAVVKITSGKNTIKNIDRVVVMVGDTIVDEANSSQSALIKAIDKDGNQLDVLSDPDEVTVKVTAKTLVKKVKINIMKTGKLPKNIQDITFTSEPNEVEISGDKDVLKNIKEVTVWVDVSEITGKTSELYRVDIPDQVSVEPENVLVNITPIFITDTQQEKPKASEETEPSTSKDKAKGSDTTSEGSE